MLQADADNELIARKVMADRVQVFTERAIGGAISSILGTVLLAWMQAPIAGLSRSIEWFLCINAVEILILAWGFQYHRTKPPESDAPAWAKRQIICAPLLGIAWGVSVWFFWVDGQILYYIANLTVLVTVTALTLTIVAPFASATILFTAGILLPILTQLLVVNNPLALQIFWGLTILFVVQVRYATIARQQLLAGLETAQRNAFLAERLRVSEHRMLIAQQISNTGSWVYDHSKGRLLASAECSRIFGYAAEAREFSLDEIESRITERDRTHQSLMDVIERGKSETTEFEIKPVDGSAKRQVRAIARLEISDIGGQPLVHGFVQDITKSKQLEEQVRNLAFYDSLTKLANRHLLNDRLSQSLVQNQRSALWGALMFIDLDNFKPLNDAHGHATGDLLLVEVAHRLMSCVRKGDTVARFGGDEFVVMLHELDKDQATSRSQAELVAEKIRESLAQPYLLSVASNADETFTIEHRCTASIGVAVFLDQHSKPDEVLKWADTAMYRAKASGRNRVCFFDDVPA